MTATAFSNSSDTTSKKNYTFNYKYKDVWGAAQVVLGSYPLETNDKRAGLIRTTPLKPGQFWQPPFEKKIEDNYSQTLTFQFYKPSSTRTQLQILKKSTVTMDFLGSERSIVIEPWEELRLVYKIKREIEINQILNRVEIN